MHAGQLFTTYFLEDGIQEANAWNEIRPEDYQAVHSALAAIYASFPLDGAPIEAQTEQDLIFPVMEALGWGHYLTQTNLSPKGRQHVPDMLLFAGEAEKSKANAEREPARRFRHGLVICENKAWQLPLDRASSGGSAGEAGVPSTQILRYLSLAEVQSDGRISWGILTNGRHWRLYYQRAHSRSEQFLELDLPAILGLPGFESIFLPNDAAREHWLKVFLLMFRRRSFLPEGVPGRSFHELALDEGRLWEERVAQDLSELVFENVFPTLIKGLARSDPQAPEPFAPGYLAEVKEAALILLYRLLFVLYAEDRNLLPVRDERYEDYGMRRPVRQHIADRMDRGDVFSSSGARYFNIMKDLFRIIDLGDESIGVPPYNGGLFSSVGSKGGQLLERVQLPDSVFAPVIDLLSRRVDGTHRRWISYRDLSVQQLGSIYERLLEYEPFLEHGGISIQPNVFARKGSGSYYTPEELVRLIIERTVGPLLRERRAVFLQKAEELESSPEPLNLRMAELAELDPASAMLDLSICDPAMGSGHFLVSLVDYLADNILEAMAEAEAAVHWDDETAPYRSPLARRIATLRRQILDQAQTRKWVVAEAQLDDRLLVRRIILKRVIHGVDQNPMAVELAKVSLWLHTFTVGAPLSFLDHHVRCGNSLFGEWVHTVDQELASSAFSLLLTGYVNRAMQAAEDMQRIEELPDIDIGEVRNSVQAFGQVRQETLPLWSILDLRQALRWLGVDDLSGKRLPIPIKSILSGDLGDLLHLASKGLDEDDGKQPDLESKVAKMPRPKIVLNAARAVGRCLEITREQRFLHWQVAFPDVWRAWKDKDRQGGFDAIIGNPPWDRMKYQEVEWFAARRSEIAKAQTADQRKKLIVALRRKKDPLVKDYEKAIWSAETAAGVARRQGEYPLLSSGDVNIYSLFVERAFALIKPAGMVGLLTPSGIAGDKGASEFFKGIASTGRLAFLFDFENRRYGKPRFFPDVDGRFKFCTFIAGGPQRSFSGTRCGFFLDSAQQVEDPERTFTLSAQDFASINPNTGTAPVFRTQRDADITRGIYDRVPVLVDRREAEPKAVWPVRYATMFHMTNDSHLFRTASQLQEQGCYRVAGNRWKRGEEEYVPLYIGRMINQFDHRAASVSVNLENIHNQAFSQLTTLDQHTDVSYQPLPQFWVPQKAAEAALGLPWMIVFRDIARPTDVRTIIAAVVPFAGFGNTLPLIIPKDSVSTAFYKEQSPLLLANLNSFVLDFIARQKVQGTHLNWYIVEQLPVLPASAYETSIGTSTAAELVRREVLKLTFASHDMRAFAQDMGYSGPPFAWDEDERRHARARLDALHFLLYGVDRDDAAYILDTFPIVREQDTGAFGHYLSKELILGYLAAFQAGDTQSRIVPAHS